MRDGEMFNRKKNQDSGGEICRSTVRVPRTTTLQELGHHHQGPYRRASDRVQTHALVRLYENTKSPVHGGRYYLVTVGGDMDPYPVFVVHEGIVAAYRVFLLVQAVIAAGAMDQEAQSHIPEVITNRRPSHTTWAEKTLGRGRLKGIVDFPVAKMPSRVQAIYRQRTSGGRR